jgi:hypothetical protein
MLDRHGEGAAPEPVAATALPKGSAGAVRGLSGRGYITCERGADGVWCYITSAGLDHLAAHPAFATSAAAIAAYREALS